MRLALLASLLSVGLAVACSRREPLPVLGEVPAFELTGRGGARVSRDDLLGKVWVADFVFTRCAGPCRMMTSHMADLQREIAELEGVRLVSVTVDPENDTPEVLERYAAAFGADPGRWLFLTGEKQAIYDLVRQGFMLAIDDGALTPGGKPGPGIITHSTRFVLVDRQGRIRGFYHGEEADVAQTILPDIQALLAEPS